MTKCNKCKIEMAKGVALQNTLTGIPDFPGGKVCTVSRNGPAKLIDVLKCPQCGKSFSYRELSDD